MKRNKDKANKYPGLCNHKTILSFGTAIIFALMGLLMGAMAVACLDRLLDSPVEIKKLTTFFGPWGILFLISAVVAFVYMDQRIVAGRRYAKMPRKRLGANIVGLIWSIVGVVVVAAGGFMFMYAMRVWGKRPSDIHPGFNTLDYVMSIAGLATIAVGILCILAGNQKCRQHHNEVCSIGGNRCSC